jgi:hypothetical protein
MVPGNSIGDFPLRGLRGELFLSLEGVQWFRGPFLAGVAGQAPVHQSGDVFEEGPDRRDEPQSARVIFVSFHPFKRTSPGLHAIHSSNLVLFPLIRWWRVRRGGEVTMRVGA